MRKALLTFGVDACAPYMAVTRPGLIKYAAKHGYTYIEVTTINQDRPPSWGKIPWLQWLLPNYDAVLWVDADVVVVDGDKDIADAIPDEAWQAMAVHTHLGSFNLGEIPSCGVWWTRPALLPALDDLWAMTQYIHTPLWEQRAMLDLLGYRVNGSAVFPVIPGQKTHVAHHTHFLPESWHSIAFDDPDAVAVFMHVPGVLEAPQRLAMLKTWVDRASARLKVVVSG